ncbi:MFS transporter [Novosphingobium aquimarinum]|jgi:DHA1 family tetracycline resistance protein-like MFS transporter|uniref:MFS transporter n=1 Tax=Novosphingobium aquimarinum TaxID=2682494 RepID=UPI0012EC7651|nr:MFS transporter [Novosphingobium aquimarinum]
MTEAATETRDEQAGEEASGVFSMKPLMFETFVCSMAMMSFVALAGPIARVLGLEPWQVGAAMTASGIAWMIMARFWGGLSDRRGRRPIILLGLTGFAVSYFLLSLFIDLALRTAMASAIAFAGLVLGRGIAGVFYAAVPATSAALVADHTPPEKRASAMAAIGASSAAGMVIGPGFAGLVGPISLSLPLYVTAALPAIALVVLWRVLPKVEHHTPPKSEPVRLADKRLRRPIAVAFVGAFSVAVAQITVGFFALDRLHLDPAHAAHAAGIALAVVGVALVCAQIVLRKLGWPPERLIRIGAVISAIGFASVMLATQAPILWAAYAVAAFGMGWVYPSISALAANAVEAHEQGAAAGSVAAAQGLGIIVGPIAGTALYGLDNGLPFAFIAAMLVGAGLWRTRSFAPEGEVSG